MNIVTGREFRFSFFLNDPASVEHEYGAMIKTVFEVTTALIPGPIGVQAFPLRGLMPAGYFGPNVFALATSVPVLKFHYLGISVFPQATGARPVPSVAGVPFQWYWTAGNQFALTDVSWIESGWMTLEALEPSKNGSATTNAFNGMVCEVDPLILSRPGAAIAYGSLIFPPVDAGDATLISPWTLFPSPYDGFPLLNLIYATFGGPGGSSISAGIWRFVHLFSETTR